MIYKLSDLLSNINYYITNLNINKNIINNPSYNYILNEIVNIINSINNIKDVNVYQNSNKIFFNYVDDSSNNFDNYQFEIINNQDNITCNLNIDKSNIVNKKIVNEKKLIRLNINIDDLNNINITKYNTSITDYNSNINEYYVEPTLKLVENINSSGIMTSKNMKLYSSYKLNGNINNINLNINNDLKDEDVIEEYIIKRKYIDIARYIEYTNGEITYNSIVPINTNNIYLLELPYNIYKGNIIIPSLSDRSINKLINSVNNTNMQEGLKQYIIGRNKYFYSSINDTRYVNIYLHNKTR